jgi:hypothetical protein
VVNHTPHRARASTTVAIDVTRGDLRLLSVRRRSATTQIQHVAHKPAAKSPGRLSPPTEMAGAVAGDYPL